MSLPEAAGESLSFIGTATTLLRLGGFAVLTNPPCSRVSCRS
jgi:hypothetical protein